MVTLFSFFEVVARAYGTSAKKQALSGGRWVRPALLVALLFLAVSALQAQEGNGVIAGTVVDAKGLVVQGATVTFTSQAKLSSKVVTSDAQGAYSSPPLASGLYTVVVAKPSFGPVEQRDFELNDDQHATLNFTLHVGDVSQQVDVQADLPQLNTFNATLGTVIDNASAEELPSNGSGALALAQLDSNVVAAQGAVADGFYDRGLGVSNIRIGGGAAGANAQLLDGGNNLQNVRGEVLINQTITGVQEMRIQYGVIAAQYGLTSGGVISMTTKAGSSGFHGQAYEFFKNGALNAENHFGLHGVRPIQNYNQYGGALGGPLYKDRAFFFTNYERYNLSQVTPVTISVPTLAERGGDFSDEAILNGAANYIYDPLTTVYQANSTTITSRQPFTNNAIDPSRFDPAAVAFQNAFVPKPNTGNPNVPVNNYVSNAPLIASQVIQLGRVDFQASRNVTIFARYAYYKNSNNNEGNYGALNTIASTRNDVQTSQDLNIGITQVLSPSLVNDVRVAVGRSYLPSEPGSAGQSWPKQLGISNLPEDTLPQLTISNYGIQVSTNVVLKTSTDPEVNDLVTYLHGRHSIHGGAGIRFNEAYSNSNSAPSGQYGFSTGQTSSNGTSATTGNAYASFLLGTVSSLITSVSAGSTTRSYAIDGFVQDDWRLGSRLVLNMGLRYDFQSVPWEKANGFSTLKLTQNPLTGLPGTEVYAGVNGQPSNFVPESYTNFGARLGFAYLLSQKSNTVIRGGYAMYYANTFNLVYANATDEFGTNVTTYSAPTTAPTTTQYLRSYVTQFSTGLPGSVLGISGASAGPSALLSQTATYQPATAKTPMSQQFVLSVARQFAKNTLVSISAFQNHGTNFPMVAVNLDQLNPMYFSNGATFLNANSTNPYASLRLSNGSTLSNGLGNAILSNAQLLKPYPYFTGVYSYYPHIGRFMGRVVQLSVQRPISRNLSVTMSYSYGKFMSDPLVSSLTQSGISSPLQNSYDPHSEYGADPTDVTHNLSGFVVYSFPFGQNQRYFGKIGKRVNRFIGGWGLSSIIRGQSGRPLSFTGSNGYVANRPNYVPGVSLKLQNASASEWFNTAAFSAVAPCPTTGTAPCINPAPYYSFGNVPRTETQVRGPGAFNLDLNLTKQVRFGKIVADFQASAFNAINKTNYGTPSTAYSTTSSSFGTITSASASRTMQLTARLRF